MSTTDPTTPEPASAGDAAEPVVDDLAAAAREPEPLIEPERPEQTVFAAQVPPVGESAPGPVGTETSEVIVAEVVEDEPAAAFVPPVQEPVVAPAAPSAPAPQPGGQPQVVYVQPIQPPKKAGNRGVGTLLVAAATVVYAGVLVGIAWLLEYFFNGNTGVAFLGSLKFWLPVVAFAVAFLLVTLLVNRANWWAHILGSLVVAAAVYFATAGGAVALDAMYGVATPTTFAAGLIDPFVILAAVAAREIAVWTGAILARRGRRLKIRNAEAREAYEREAAERRAATGY